MPASLMKQSRSMDIKIYSRLRGFASRPRRFQELLCDMHVSRFECPFGRGAVELCFDQRRVSATSHQLLDHLRITKIRCVMKCTLSAKWCGIDLDACVQ